MKAELSRVKGMAKSFITDNVSTLDDHINDPMSPTSQVT